jgi:hypothetical protein
MLHFPTLPGRPDNAQGIPGRIFAVPSWVIPGTLAENCVFLAGKADEAGLLFLETEACLAYGGKDLPTCLAELPLRYHAHLPVDLPWADPEKTASACAALLDKIVFLGAERRGTAFSPLRAVLHPPVNDPADSGAAARKLARFAGAFVVLGHAPSSLLLENVPGNDLSGLRGVIREYNFGVCPDTGHALACGRTDILREPALLERAALLHLSAPGKGKQAGRHLPLPALDKAGKALCATLCREAPAKAVLMLELFRWQDILDSLPLVRSWLLPQG